MATTETVLIVDDEPDAGLLFEQAFDEESRAGALQLFFASSGKEALQLLEEHPDTAVVVTDIRMPGMSGLELLEKIQSQSPLLRVVIMSAYSDMPNIRRAMHLGAYDFLTKPLDLQDLRATVQRAMRDFRDRADRETAFALQMRQAQMGELLSVIAHQWRQPLSTATLLAGFGRAQLLDNKIDGKAAADMFRQIEEQTVFMSDTIRYFRDMYSQKTESTRFDVAVIIGQAVNLMVPAMGDVEIDYSPQSAEVESFPGDLLQVMLCFLQNASEVFTRRPVAAPKISIRVTASREGVSIEVEDNGGGIEGNPESVFKRGFSTKGSSGLGLYVARMLVETRCRGALTVQNGKAGAVFLVRLPGHHDRGAS